jgi:crotonobetainyl-CoA:carnitine CoA-transferase CaiB-like acyl-CoA transferase
VWWAPVQTPREVIGDPQLLATGGLVDIEVPGGEALRSVAAPVDFSGVPTGPVGPVPGLGAHTDEVLAELGFSDEEIAALHDQAVVGSGQ